MKKHSMPEMKEGGVNVTPLIDVVMCLIIFFMLVAKIGVTTGAEPMPNLVKSILGVKIEDMGNTLTVNVHRAPAGSIPDCTALAPNAVSATSISLEQLTGLLKQLRQTNPDFKLILRGPADLPFSQLGALLRVAQNAGITNIAFNTKTVETEEK